MILDDLDAVLLGFPKCGTTSLAAWLDGAATVRVSLPKETFTLCPEFADNHGRAGGLTLAEAFAGSGHAAGADGAERPAPCLVEASSLNVYSQDLRERAAGTGTRFIVMVRDHAPAVESWHEQMVYAGDAAGLALRDAWQEALAIHRRGAAGSAELKRDYVTMFSQAEWLQRWIDSVGHERLLIVQGHELRDGAALAGRMGAFLGTDLDGAGEVERRNSRLTRNARWLRFVKGPALRRLVRRVDSNGRIEQRARELVRSRFSAKAPEPIDQGLRDDIAARFEPDAARLQGLIRARGSPA